MESTTGEPNRRHERSQAPPVPIAPPDESPKALREAALAQVQRNAEALRKHPLAVTTEPAFNFKP